MSEVQEYRPLLQCSFHDVTNGNQIDLPVTSSSIHVGKQSSTYPIINYTIIFTLLFYLCR